MTLQIYLDDEVRCKILQLAQTPGGAERKVIGRSFSLDGLRVTMDPEGRPVYKVQNEEAPVAVLVPPALRGHVAVISWWTTIPSEDRMSLMGLYRPLGTEATLDWDSKEGVFRLKIEGPDIGNIKRAYQLIRAGLVTPDEAWEYGGEEQGNPSPTPKPQLRIVKSDDKPGDEGSSLN